MLELNIDEFFHVNFLEMIIRTSVTFAVLLLLARLLGKIQLSQLTFFNYITGITIGSIAAEMAGKHETSFTDGLISLIWWSFLTVLTSYIGLKSSKARVILDGEPTIVIKAGKILENSLKSLRLNIDDLSMMLREQGVFSTNDVEYAVLEPDGNLSILKKASLQSATKKDMLVPTEALKYVPSELISDGKILKKNLQELNITEEWLLQKLKAKGISSVEDVFYAEIQTDGALYIDLHKDNLK